MLCTYISLYLSNSVHHKMLNSFFKVTLRKTESTSIVQRFILIPSEKCLQSWTAGTPNPPISLHSLFPTTHPCSTPTPPPQMWCSASRAPSLPPPHLDALCWTSQLGQLINPSDGFEVSLTKASAIYYSTEAVSCGGSVHACRLV